MQLPTAHCPHCAVSVLVYGWVDPANDTNEGPVRTRCVDCDTFLDRFGVTPDITRSSISDLVATGYVDLDRGRPVGPGGCFENDGCEGCPKIDTRPW